MGAKYDALVVHLRQLTNLITVRTLVSWDQQTQMPPGASGFRAGQMATFSRLIHEFFTSEDTLRLLDAAAEEVGDADFDSDEASMIRVVRRDYEEATRLPAAFVTELAELTSRSRQILGSGACRQRF